MGVFKWLRRDRLSLSSRRSITDENIPEGSAEDHNIGTIRTEEYKRSLAEFQARRLSGQRNAFQTPDNRPKRKSARHSLPISCTKCKDDVADVSFNYERSSMRNYNKSKSRRNSTDERIPNIQFLFSNQQVFMPGNIFTKTSFSEVQQSKRSSSSSGKSRDSSLTKHQIDFEVEDGSPESPPLYFKDNCLPFDISDFVDNVDGRDDSVAELNNLKYRMEPERDAYGERSKAESPSRSSEGRLEEVMNELKHFDEWADEQLRMQSICTDKSDESKSEISYYGLPVVSSSAIDIKESDPHSWEYGSWGIIPVHVKKLHNVTLEQVKKRQCVEVNILRKFRHPNIMLLMGVYSDANKIVHLICERCVATLHTIIHDQGNILSVQTSVSYASDVASALVFLRMQGFLHTNINSANIMVTSSGVAKISDLRSCVKVASDKAVPEKLYGDETQYVSIGDVKYSTADSRPLLSASASESDPYSIAKAYGDYANSDKFRWHAPELFKPDEAGLVYPCAKSDVYSLCMVLWECCNAAIPWKTLTYEKLGELYQTWKTGIRLPLDGTYPGCLLELMQSALKLNLPERIDLTCFAEKITLVKSKLSDIDDILIPFRIAQKRSGFSSNWETNSLSDADCHVSRQIRVSSHTALVHRSTSESSRQDDNDNSPDEGVYGVHKDKTSAETSAEDEPVKVKYGKLPTKEFSSTPITKKRVSLKEIGTPGEQLHKSDSTEYCSILSQNRNLDLTDAEEKPTEKLMRSFTPKKYTSLQIQIPSVENLDDVKSLSSAKESEGPPSYKFDIKEYSLPNTPIARSNKLRKNAWLSGESIKEKKSADLKIVEDGDKSEQLSVKSAPQFHPRQKHTDNDEVGNDKATDSNSPQSATSEFDQYCSMKSPPNGSEYFPFTTSTLERCRSHSWSCRPPELHDLANNRVPEEVLNHMNVKPLVAIHERWISEANRKNERSYSTPDGYRRIGPSVKPASHSVDPLQTSVPFGRKNKLFRNNVTMSPSSSYTSRKSSLSEQFTTARDKIARSMSFTSRDPDKHEINIWSKERTKW